MMRTYLLLAHLTTLGLIVIDAFCHSFTIFHESTIPVPLHATEKSSNDFYNNPSPSYRRSVFLQTLNLGFMSMVMNIDIAYAAGDESKGTKDDPKFQACMSKCVFECTKPKGEEQKSRSECLPECKTKCATTKEQLLLGRPLNK